jgi:hypothetical protein
MQKQPAVHEGRRARSKLKERGQGKRTLHRNRNACFNHPLTLNPALQGELFYIIKNSRLQWAGILARTQPELMRTYCKRTALQLAANAKLPDERSIALDVSVGQVREHALSATDHHKQPPSGVMIVLVFAQVVGKLVDARSQQRNLNFG